MTRFPQAELLLLNQGNRGCLGQPKTSLSAPLSDPTTFPSHCTPKPWASVVLPPQLPPPLAVGEGQHWQNRAHP